MDEPRDPDASMPSGTSPAGQDASEPDPRQPPVLVTPGTPNSNEDSGAPTSGASSADLPSDLDASVEAQTCPPMEQRTRVEVDAEITRDEVWTCANLYWIGQQTYVVNGAALAIEAGTEIRAEGDAALVITRGSRLHSNGTAEAPVVFTSGATVGTRGEGDWGGVVLLGAARINQPSGEAFHEGVDRLGTRAVYGGDDESSSCGRLKYTRIEFAGNLGLDIEAGGLTLAGCGAATEVDYVQVHRSLEDGVEIAGGAPVLRHVLVTEASDDGVDWSQGWTGAAQFLVVFRSPGSLASAGMEGENDWDLADAEPRSNPVVKNFTISGSMAHGVLLRHGTWGSLSNGIVEANGGRGIELRDAETIIAAMSEPPGVLVARTIFFGNDSTFAPFDPSAPTDFDQASYFSRSDFENLVDVDPEFGTTSSSGSLNLVPSSSGPASSGDSSAPLDSRLDDGADYIGAFNPKEPEWSNQWASFPVN